MCSAHVIVGFPCHAHPFAGGSSTQDVVVAGVRASTLALVLLYVGGRVPQNPEKKVSACGRTVSLRGAFFGRPMCRSPSPTPQQSSRLSSPTASLGTMHAYLCARPL